jgi:transposase-like protein
LVITAPVSTSAAPAGYRFPRDVLGVAVRWYLPCGPSYRDVEELLAERGITVDHVTIYRWVQVQCGAATETWLLRREGFVVQAWVSASTGIVLMPAVFVS